MRSLLYIVGHSVPDSNADANAKHFKATSGLNWSIDRLDLFDVQNWKRKSAVLFPAIS